MGHDVGGEALVPVLVRHGIWGVSAEGHIQNETSSNPQPISHPAFGLIAFEARD